MEEIDPNELAERLVFLSEGQLLSEEEVIELQKHFYAEQDLESAYKLVSFCANEASAPFLAVFLDCLRTLLDMRPLDPTLGHVFCDDEDYVSAAIEVWETTLEKHQTDPQFLRNYAKFLTAGAPDRALIFWNKAVNLDPDNADLHREIAEFYKLYALSTKGVGRQTYVGKAAEELEKGLTLLRQKPVQCYLATYAESILYDLGMFALENSLLDTAQKCATQLISLCPHKERLDSVEITKYRFARYKGLHLQGLASLAQNNSDLAISCLAQMSEAVPPTPLMDLAQALLEAGHQHAVLNHLVSLRELIHKELTTPEQQPANVSLAKVRLLMQSSSKEDVLQHYNRSLQTKLDVLAELIIQIQNGPPFCDIKEKWRQCNR